MLLCSVMGGRLALVWGVLRGDSQTSSGGSAVVAGGKFIAFKKSYKAWRSKTLTEVSNFWMTTVMFFLCFKVCDKLNIFFFISKKLFLTTKFKFIFKVLLVLKKYFSFVNSILLYTNQPNLKTKPCSFSVNFQWSTTRVHDRNWV